MNRTRKHIPAVEKMAILKRYMVDKVPVSDLCDQYGLQPSQVYHWQALLFEHGAAALDRRPGRQVVDPKDRRIAQLETQLGQKEAKLAQKNEVIAELMEENVRSKKAAGEP